MQNPGFYFPWFQRESGNTGIKTRGLLNSPQPWDLSDFPPLRAREVLGAAVAALRGAGALGAAPWSQGSFHRIAARAWGPKKAVGVFGGFLMLCCMVRIACIVCVVCFFICFVCLFVGLFCFVCFPRIGLESGAWAR